MARCFMIMLRRPAVAQLYRRDTSPLHACLAEPVKEMVLVIRYQLVVGET